MVTRVAGRPDALAGYRTRVRVAGHTGRKIKGLRLAWTLLGMATSMRPLRYIPPGSLVEVTSRTIQGRLLLRPSRQVNDIILGVIGRALALFDVKVCALAVLSNHFHALLLPADAAELARFMAHIKRNISKELGRLHHWPGPLWDRRYRAIVIADEASQVERLRYIFEQGTKEGLVARPDAWPGVHCVDALVDGTPMSGTWLDRSAMYEARRRSSRDIERSAFECVYPVHLSPLPCWRGLPETERQARCAIMVAQIEEQYAAINEALERQPVGAAFVLAQDPHGQPRSSDRSPAPLVHASSKRVREMFRAAYRRFVDAFRHAAERVRQGVFDAAFPLHSFPPPRPFVQAAVST
jgi:hypothetical protein